MMPPASPDLRTGASLGVVRIKVHRNSAFRPPMVDSWPLAASSLAIYPDSFSSLHTLIDLRPRLDFRDAQLECLLKVLP